MKVLIAGCGSLGQRVVHALQAQSDVQDDNLQITAFRRDVSALAHLSDVTLHAVDLTDAQSVRTLDRDWTHVVFTPAAGRFTREAYEAVFVQGLNNILDHVTKASNAPRLVLVSSTSVYGTDTPIDVTEATRVNPTRFNGEVLARAEARLRDVPNSTILRLSGLYGPSRMRLAHTLRQGGRTLPMDANYWVNRIHEDDAARAIVHLLQLPSVVPLYLGSDGTPLPARHFYRNVARLLNAPELPLSEDDVAQVPGIQKRRILGQALKRSGFVPHWSNALSGYRAMLTLA